MPTQFLDRGNSNFSTRYVDDCIFFCCDFLFVKVCTKLGNINLLEASR